MTSYEYSCVFSPEFTAQVNAVIGPAVADLGLDPPGVPGQPATYNMDPLTCINLLGSHGWRYRDRIMVEPHWPDENGPPVYGTILERVVPSPT